MSIERLRALADWCADRQVHWAAQEGDYAQGRVNAFCEAEYEIRQSIAELGQEVGAVADAMTLSAPPKVWLQVDTDALEDAEREAIPRDCWDQLTWCAESVGGHEVRYIREDLATSPAHTSEARDAEIEAVKSALDRAYWLGQEYCRLADSQSYSDNRRSDETRSRYNQLVIDTLAAMRQEGGNG